MIGQSIWSHLVQFGENQIKGRWSSKIFRERCLSKMNVLATFLDWNQPIEGALEAYISDQSQNCWQFITKIYRFITWHSNDFGRLQWSVPSYMKTPDYCLCQIYSRKWFEKPHLEIRSNEEPRGPWLHMADFGPLNSSKKYFPESMVGGERCVIEMPCFIFTDSPLISFKIKTF